MSPQDRLRADGYAAERNMVLAYNSDFFGLLVSSYRRTVGAEPAFFEPGQQPSAPWLDERARHCVLAHNTDPDPRFIYANKAAQGVAADRQRRARPGGNLRQVAQRVKLFHLRAAEAPKR
jgi:MEKHLA domain